MTLLAPEDTAAFEAQGFVTVKRLVEDADCERLKHEVGDWLGASERGTGAGARNLLREVPWVAQLATGERMGRLARELLGSAAFPVRALWFDKTAEANWKVPWHQDLAIAVSQRAELEGFTGWSVKEGVVHVHPPEEILAAMVTVRLHLDDCGPDNGPLRVLPGSHRGGRKNANDIARLRQEGNAIECVAARGDAVVMCPLLLHASSPAKQPGHRRVLHVEFAATELPGGLRWAFR